MRCSSVGDGESRRVHYIKGPCFIVFYFHAPHTFFFIYFSFALTAYLALSRTLCLHFLYTIPSLQLCLKSIPPPHTQFFPHDLAHEPYLTTHLVMIRINISRTCTNVCTRLSHFSLQTPSTHSTRLSHFYLQTPSTHSTLPTPLAPPLPTHPACPNPPPLFHTQR